MALVKPHGKKKKLMPLLLSRPALQKELKKAAKLKQLKISSRETADLVMMGIGAFTPLTGFMGKKDWKGGRAKDRSQPDVNLAGPVKVLSEAHFPDTFKGIYMTPVQTRRLFEEKGWSKIAAFQTRNPMHRSHEYLAKIAIETMDGVLIHSLLGALKPGDIPAEVRSEAISVLVDNYFAPNTVIQAGYPLDMRYAGPREALLHALFRQNYGCSHLIVGRDHAGVGDYYGPFDAQKIFDEIPKDALETKNMNIDWTFWCNKCGGMASQRTCPHTKDDRILLSGTKVRAMLSEGKDLPVEFSRPEVAKVLQKYYAGLSAEQNVKVELKGHSAQSRRG